MVRIHPQPYSWWYVVRRHIATQAKEYILALREDFGDVGFWIPSCLSSILSLSTNLLDFLIFNELKGYFIKEDI